jgi:hypothetical protein
VFSLTWEENVLPRIAACVAAIENHYFVVVDVGIKQIGAVNCTHLQFAAHTLKHQSLADGVVLIHGIDTSEKLPIKIRLQVVLAQQARHDGIKVEVVEKPLFVELPLTKVANHIGELHQQVVQVHMTVGHDEDSKNKINEAGSLELEKTVIAELG